MSTAHEQISGGMRVAEAIRTMRSIRRFAERPLPDDAVRAILNAGRRAQSSKNTQPWYFVAVRDRATLVALSQCGLYAGHLAGAALGVALAAAPGNDYDLGQATACMQLAAWEIGIGSCIASIHEPERAGAVLGLPAELTCDVALSFGYPAEEHQPAPRQGGRKPLEDVVRWDRWS